jgi:hypothetical protein
MEDGVELISHRFRVKERAYCARAIVPVTINSTFRVISYKEFLLLSFFISSSYKTKLHIQL